MEDNFIKRYVGAYLIVYIVLSVLFAASAYIPVLDKLPNSFSFIIAMVSAYWPGQRFAKDYGRKPDKAEKHRFARIGFAAVTVLSCVVVALLWAFLIPAEDKDALLGSIAGLPAWAYAVIVVLTVLLYYWVMVLGFCTGAKMELKALEKQRAKGQI